MIILPLTEVTPEVVGWHSWILRRPMRRPGDRRKLKRHKKLYRDRLVSGLIILLFK